MSETNKGMLAAIERYFAKIEGLISGGSGGGSADAIFYASTSIAAGATFTKDLLPLIPAGSEHARSCTVEVKIMDTVVGSLTQNCWIDASAILTWGIKEDGTLIIGNPTTGGASVWIKVMAPHKKLAP